MKKLQDDSKLEDQLNEIHALGDELLLLSDQIGQQVRRRFSAKEGSMESLELTRKEMWDRVQSLQRMIDVYKGQNEDLKRQNEHLQKVIQICAW
jgi:hypothetical protein